jgi:membrane protease YdiL (CAAX protease family)
VTDMINRIRSAIEIVVALSVLLAARALVPEVPYRNAYFMAVTLAVIFLVVTVSGEGLRSLGIGKPVSWKRFFAWTGVALAGTVIIGLVLYPLIASWLPAPPDTGDGVGGVGSHRLTTLILVGWFAAAFGEEVTFRGFVLPKLAGILGGTSAGWILAIVVQAAIFAALHASQLGMVIAGLFGLWFGLVFWRSGKLLWPVIIAHALPDTVSILSSG